jgi:hypothetical protein
VARVKLDPYEDGSGFGLNATSEDFSYLIDSTQSTQESANSFIYSVVSLIAILCCAVFVIWLLFKFIALLIKLCNDEGGLPYLNNVADTIKSWVWNLIRLIIILAVAGVLVQLIFGGGFEVGILGRLINLVSELGDGGAFVGLIALVVVLVIFKNQKN